MARASDASDSFANIHDYYMQIMNAVPDIVYWVDMNCMLKGYNKSFVDLCEAKKISDLNGSPYDQFIKYAQWSSERVDALKLDDMSVIFTGEAKSHVREPVIYDKAQKPRYFVAHRIPLFDAQKHVCGLVVVLSDVTVRHELELKLKLTEPKLSDDLMGKRISSPRILMVEDNPIAQKIEETLFRALNCDVDLAESGERALQLFSPNKYDLVLMDIGLEDTSGYVVTKKIRQIEKESDQINPFAVPIIALTAYQANIVKYDCQAYLMDGVITKPLTGEQAHQLLQRFVFKKDVVVDGLQVD